MTPAWLPELLARHPACREEDVLKALFQSLYGNGHLLGDAETVRNRIAEETASAGPGRGEPLIEPLGGWIRLNLRPAREAQLPPAWIQAMMSASGPAPADPRDGRLQESVRALDPLPGFSMARLAALADGLDGLPSHSEACRAAEQPAYRLLDSAWEPVIPLLCGIARLRSSESPLLITLDGPCGGGKSTLAAALGTVLGCTVLHMDDYVIPHAQKTPERLAKPGGNADAERLCRELLNPLLAGQPGRYSPYDCRRDRLGEPRAVRPRPFILLEGSCSNLPVLREKAALRIFLTEEPATQEARLRQRCSPAQLEAYHHRWIPLEQAYFEAFALPDPGCVLLRAEDLRLERLKLKPEGDVSA